MEEGRHIHRVKFLGERDEEGCTQLYTYLFLVEFSRVYSEAQWSIQKGGGSI